MNWQMMIAVTMVALSGCYLLRCAWRTWSGKGKGCGHGCGCGPKKEKEGGDLIQLDNGRIRNRRL